MCFSATASLVASGALTAAGIETLGQSKGKARAFAAIPLIFGFQQAVEGAVWLSFGHPALNAVFSFVYVLFSHVLWPTFLPLAVWSIEPQPRRKKLLRWFARLGSGVSLLLLAFIVTGGVSSAIMGECISYQIRIPDTPLLLVAYLVATCGACFVSSRRLVKIFGAALFLSLLISLWAYRTAFASVWCFFAACLSLIILLQVRQMRSEAGR